MEAVHDALGARWTDAPGGRVPRNYGDPATEYDAARNDVVIADRADRAFLRVYGRDPVKMIQGLISNDIENAPPGRVVYAAVLTPKGKMIADVRVLRQGADLLMEVDAGALDGLAAHLRKFVPPLFARFEDVRGAWREIGVYGPRAASLAHDVLGADVSRAAEDDVFAGSLAGAQVVLLATATHDVPGFDLVVPADRAEDVWRALADAGARPVGHATLDVLRIEAGRPRWGAELDGNTIPLEAGLRERAISQTKGCYTGQEVIVRILHRGHVNWILRRVLLGEAAAPARDTKLMNADGKVVGRITSAAWSPKFGQAVGLAYVRREVEPGSQVTMDGVAVTVSDAEPDV